MTVRAGRTLDDVDEQILVDYSLSAARTARHALAASMRDQQVAPEVVDEASLVVSELVTNSVQHSDRMPGEQIRAAWTLRKGVIEVAVTDGGGGPAPRPARRHVLADNGRGLRIVRSLAHEWGVVDGVRTRTVWASLGGPSRRRTR